jgi:hypothetical protein
MSEESNNEPFSEAHLNSPEYRERLTRKLNCLIALLEVAMARVRRSLKGPEPDVERLTKIRTNLQSTLDVCLRARTAIERQEPLPTDLPESLSNVSRPEKAQVLRPRAASLPMGAHHELSSVEETRKFQRLGKISNDEVESVDIEELTRKLQGL